MYGRTLKDDTSYLDKTIRLTAIRCYIFRRKHVDIVVTPKLIGNEWELCPLFQEIPYTPVTDIQLFGFQFTTGGRNPVTRLTFLPPCLVLILINIIQVWWQQI